MKLLDEEVYILPYEKAHDKKLIYAPIRGAVELVQQHTADIITNGAISTKEDLEKYPHIRRLIKEIQKMPLQDLDVMKRGLPMLNIDLSSGCNMRCVYCYAGRGEGSIVYQENQNIDMILDTYFNYLYTSPDYKHGTSCSIAFTNDAEPTFAPELLKYAVVTAVERAKKFNIKPVFTLPTNGAFKEDLRGFIIKYFSMVSISFEGLSWVQNRHRPLINGEPSFHRVYENIRALYQSGVKLRFSVVVTSCNLYYLKETIDFFHENFPGSTVSFGQVNLIGRALEEQKDLNIHQQSFDDQLLDALMYGEGTSITVEGKHGHINLIPRRHYCSSTVKPNWSVSLTGDMYSCMEEKSEAMKIGGFDFSVRQLSFDEDRIKSLRRKSVDCNTKCYNCFSKYLCAGGCVSKIEAQAALCSGIRQRNLHLINRAYENRLIRVEAQELFQINQ
ncbi:radical SAM/SPASM domain-containing protein [Alkaliphilus peptidifermentans]|uniref:Radical SAM additional 4Fe4S-binding SPASM domain-containing protein n=1 Tax=Alkaliphilus peptidifermentans DSM 18978 TaxID=1120976 RepID=A0A1G5EUS2_9FIRM|nr:radical SAM protein [Alkaliphilus peptidifermentans]SCY30712.1 radical SAM additional 4Fe4S-binding SPASM domain-containing protein [Alkaliphilus peptidifermentans DSM 18978]